MKNYIFCLSLLALNNQVIAKADQSEIGLFVKSYHFNSQEENNLNQNNFGFYLIKNNFSIGGYKNSFFKNSFFIVREYALYKFLKIDVGLISGYKYKSPFGKLYSSDNKKHSIIPLVSPKIIFPFFDKTNLNIHVSFRALAFSISSHF